MSVTNQTNGWSSWSNDLTQGVNFLNHVTTQVSSIQNQLNSLIQAYNNGHGTLTLDQFQTQSAPLITEMNSFVSSMASQNTSMAKNPYFTKISSNLNTAWQSTLQTFSNVSVPNPNYPLNSNEKTIPITFNSDGSATVTLNIPFSHDHDQCQWDGLQNPPDWLPQEGSYGYVNGQGLYFGKFLSDQDSGSQFTWGTNGDGTLPSEEVTAVENSRGVMTVTVTVDAGYTDAFGASLNPDDSAMTNFLNSI